MELMTVQQFADCLNESFQVELDEQSIEFVLVEVRPLSSAQSNVQRQSFSLMFRHSGASAVPQQTYAMHHPRLGALEIFIVPVAQEPGAFLYQAIFN